MQQQGKGPVAIIGAGIVGLCTAHALRRAGHAVTLFDPEAPGSPAQCSYGNAGALSSRSVAPLAMPGVLRSALPMLLDARSPLHIPPRYWLRAAPWLARFAAAARPARVAAIARALDELLAGSVPAHAALAREVGVPELVRGGGQLHVYPDARAYAADAASWALKRRHGLRAEPVDAQAIRELEPEVGRRYTTGVLLPDEGWLANPGRYAQAIAAALRGQGVQIVPVRIQALRQDAQGWSLAAAGRSWPARQVVVCAGAWSRALLAPLGHEVPLESQRGYHLQAPDAGVALSRLVVLGDRKVYLMPGEQGLRIAGTVEFGGLARAPNRRRAMLLAGHARAALAHARLDGAQMWMGHRPCLPDSLPVIGAVPGLPGLWCAFGHGHLGLTGSVNTGALIARAMAGHAAPQELAPFAIGRFA
ncbi:FAD-binding oxidoreductase [Orrella sp. JC864]|uniref:NAD(P)/FAD-dependent oxidoreductase n=1 Tax=Orrella sp. JC864 TaxID=3120298 RepID=UPI00300B1716